MTRNERETRAQRRARERAKTKKRLRQESSPPLLSRRGIIFTGIGIVGVSVAVVAAAATEPGQQFIERLFGNDPGTIIHKEIDKLDIQKDEEEINLWNQAYSAFSPTFSVTKDDVLQESQKRINLLFSLMRRSKNPYMKDAVEYLFSLKDSGDLAFGLRSNAPAEVEEKSPVGAGLEINGNRILLTINASPTAFLGRLSPVDLALFYTHEKEHIKIMHEHDLSLSLLSFTAEQRRSELLKRSRDYESFIQEEAIAYGKHAQAFIYQAGLLGVYPKTRLAEMAARFVQYGQDPANLNWINYIKSNLTIHPPK